ncbi:hypothetical protein ABPG75_009491 [Micractinium tetrahymenae]
MEPCANPNLLSSPALAQDLIAAQLPQEDRLSLAATCTSLRHASLRWFPEISAEMGESKAAADSLAAWLRRYRARTPLRILPAGCTDIHERRKAAQRMGRALRRLAACESATACVISIAPSSFGAQVPSAAVARFSALHMLHAGVGCGLSLWGSTQPIFALTRLRHLSLLRIGDEEQLAGLAQLPRLRRLAVGCQDARPVAAALPALRQLSSLQVFVAFHGQKRAINWRHLAGLSKLERLHLDCLRRVSELAPLLPALAPRLRSLELSANRLADLPHQLSVCSGLTHLQMRITAGHATPTAAGLQCLAALSRLQSLHLVWPCRLPAYAACSTLAVLPALTRIMLVSTVSVDGWAALSSLHQLRDMELRECQLYTLGPLSGLTALTRLAVSHDWLSDLPTAPPGPLDTAGLDALARLRNLSLAGNFHHAVPPQLSALRRLTALHLNGNMLVGGWEHLLPLQQLAHLDLTACNLAAVPAAFSALASLTRLDLRGNPHITGGWEHLQHLALLRKLVRDN